MKNMALETGYFKGLTAVFKLTFIICQASGSAIALYAEGCEPTVDNIKFDIDGQKLPVACGSVTVACGSSVLI